MGKSAFNHTSSWAQVTELFQDFLISVDYSVEWTHALESVWTVPIVFDFWVKQKHPYVIRGKLFLPSKAS